MHTILTHVGYRDGRAEFSTLHDTTLANHQIAPGPLTLEFDTSQRYCTGWHDLASGENHSCPDANTTDHKYEQCPACQRRTGFNPAFYHASSVSEQQEKRNREPHFLYLAYFAPTVLKVGISYSGRDQARLFEQGARAAMILDTFPSALIARQYEANISAMDGIFEHLTSRKKREVWSRPYDAEMAHATLNETIVRINTTLNTTFTPEFIDCNAHYFFGEQPDLTDVLDRTDSALISGSVVGCLGAELLAKNDGRLLSLNLKHFTGYLITTSDTIQSIDLPPTQATLF